MMTMDEYHGDKNHLQIAGDFLIKDFDATHNNEFG
jgi:hypothetical protein